MTYEPPRQAERPTELEGVEVASRYRILEWIGDGATGTVWRAEHIALGRECAIKVLKDTDGADSQLAARFRREARAASRLDHPNIVYISDFGRMDDGRLYLVMEYITGPSLRQVMNDARGVLPRSRTLHILRQVAAALEAAHEAGVVHRDIKPENILLLPGDDGQDTVKVLDFSLAKIFDESDLTRLTHKGDLFGTPAYMAPEQVRSDPTTTATDLYALGALAFELLTGRLPFEKPSIPAMMLAHREEPPPTPSSRLPQGARPLPVPLEHLVLSCLKKDPSERPARALDVVLALDQIWEAERAPTSTYSAEMAPAPAAGGAPPVEDDRGLRISRRLWAREQAGETAMSVVAHLRRVGNMPPVLGQMVSRLEDVGQQLDHLGNESALAISHQGDALRRWRDQLARLRYALAELSDQRGNLAEQPGSAPERLEDLDYQIRELERALSETLAEAEAGEATGRSALQAMRGQESALRLRQIAAARELALLLRAHREVLPDDPEVRTEFEDLLALLRLAEEI